jgi:DNA end-binding protein Ku
MGKKGSGEHDTVRQARKGIITFGLVSIPIELHVAARSKSLDFDMLHKKDQSRILYKLWCKEEDTEVDRKQTVKGYNVGGRYVILDEADFDTAERATSRAIDVVHFVDLDQVDPVYLERSYWVAPEKGMERAYQVLLRAMQEAQRAAVVTFVMSRRQQYAFLRADGDKFALHTLYYGDEVRELETDWKQPKPDEREVAFAGQYIKALTRDFTPDEYEDTYRKRLLAIIKAKAKGEEVELPEVRKPPAKVTNLMDALRRSAEEVRKPLAMAKGGPSAARQARKRATTARKRKKAA